MGVDAVPRGVQLHRCVRDSGSSWRRVLILATRYDRAGLLTDKTVLGHGVYLTPQVLARM